MRTISTYITEDQKKFGNIFEARKHECGLQGHKWDYYKDGISIQKNITEANDESIMRFCNKCTTQEMLF